MEKQYKHLTMTERELIAKMKYEGEDAGLFFWLLSRRYEKARLIITSNKSFVDWGEIFKSGPGNYHP